MREEKGRRWREKENDSERRSRRGRKGRRKGRRYASGLKLLAAPKPKMLATSLNMQQRASSTSSAGTDRVTMLCQCELHVNVVIRALVSLSLNCTFPLKHLRVLQRLDEH